MRAWRQALYAPSLPVDRGEYCFVSPVLDSCDNLHLLPPLVETVLRMNYRQVTAIEKRL